MTELEKYEAVNRCETIEDFCKVLRSFADDRGIIKGRTEDFNADKMANNAEDFYYDKDYSSARTVTREYGLRQQLLYLKHYK